MMKIKVLTKGARRPTENLIISPSAGFLRHSDIKEIYAIDSDFHVKARSETSYSALAGSRGRETSSCAATEI